jgi:hypothetical protein
MSKKTVRSADKNTIFICQITGSSLRVATCQAYRFGQRKFLDFEILNFTDGPDDKAIAEKVGEIFKKLGFNNNQVIASLPRISATSRYLKIPSQTPEEIENIVLLQAPRFLPYPTAELITGFEHIQTDKEGFSHINLTIAHKNIVERFTSLFRALKIKDFSLALSSYGLSNLCSLLQIGEQEPVMLLDIEHPLVELVIVAKGQLIFSRAFKISEMDWQNNLTAELNKTTETYLKELGFKEPIKIIIPDHPRVSKKIDEIISNHTNLPISRLVYQDKIPATATFHAKIAQTENSLAVLVGLGLKKIPETLNLLPKDRKERHKKQIKVRENVKFAMLVFGLIIVLALGLRQSLVNKELFLGKLKNELSKIGKDAKGFAELERRYELLEKRRDKPSLSLELISQLHKAIPQEILLNNFAFEAEKQIILRGQAPQSALVFDFVKRLETAEAFKKFNIKIRYVTQKKVLAGEVADFEIVCTRKK